MPYRSTSDINPSKRKGMTKHGSEIYKAAFNSALKKYGSEETAHKVANSAVTKAGERKKKENMTFEALINVGWALPVSRTLSSAADSLKSVVGSVSLKDKVVNCLLCGESSKYSEWEDSGFHCPKCGEYSLPRQKDLGEEMNFGSLITEDVIEDSTEEIRLWILNDEGMYNTAIDLGRRYSDSRRLAQALEQEFSWFTSPKSWFDIEWVDWFQLAEDVLEWDEVIEEASLFNKGGKLRKDWKGVAKSNRAANVRGAKGLTKGAAKGFLRGVEKGKKYGGAIGGAVGGGIGAYVGQRIGGVVGSRIGAVSGAQQGYKAAMKPSDAAKKGWETRKKSGKYNPNAKPGQKLKESSDDAMERIESMLDGASLRIVRNIDSFNRAGDVIELSQLEDDRDMMWRGYSTNPQVGSDMWSVEWILTNLSRGNLSTMDFDEVELEEALDAYFNYEDEEEN